MRRVVLDTNVLIGNAYNKYSASRRLVERCLQGELLLVVSPDVRAEYETIVPRAVQDHQEIERIEHLISRAELVHPETTPAVIRDDPADDKFLAAAVSGRADALITNDEHILALGGYRGIRILRPSEFERSLRD